MFLSVSQSFDFFVSDAFMSLVFSFLTFFDLTVPFKRKFWSGNVRQVYEWFLTTFLLP